MAGSGDSGNLIAGNVVGLNASNSVAANVLGGMFISGTSNTVGGIVSAARNVISGNEYAGLVVDTGHTGGWQLYRNRLERQGRDIEPAVDRHQRHRVEHTIGGTSAAARNVISGNATQGINITGSANLIEGNFVGTDSAGTVAVPNGVGVDIIRSKNTIGGTTAGAGNTIADNTGNGVVVNEGTGNAVLSNSIHDNTVGGIDLLNSGNNDQPCPSAERCKDGIERDGGRWFTRRRRGDELPRSVLRQQPCFRPGADAPGQPDDRAQASAGTVPLTFFTAATLPAGATVTAIASVAMAPNGSFNPAAGDISRFSNAVARGRRRPVHRDQHVGFADESADWIAEVRDPGSQRRRGQQPYDQL